MVRRLYSRAFGRNPSESEMELATRFLGPVTQAEGVEDLLWAMTMSPEFQLIY